MIVEAHWRAHSAHCADLDMMRVIPNHEWSVCSNNSAVLSRCSSTRWAPSTTLAVLVRRPGALPTRARSPRRLEGMDAAATKLGIIVVLCLAKRSRSSSLTLVRRQTVPPRQQHCRSALWPEHLRWWLHCGSDAPWPAAWLSYLPPI